VAHRLVRLYSQAVALGPPERVTIREPDVETRVRAYLASQGYVLTLRALLEEATSSRNEQAGPCSLK